MLGGGFVTMPHTGRRPIFGRPMTPAERQRRRRARLRGELPPWEPKPKRRPPVFDDDFVEGLQPIEALWESLKPIS
jgi:hypothetical protein